MLRVATFNVRFGERGLSHVTAALRGIDADLLALQELDVGAPRSWFRHQPRRIARALGYEFAFARSSRVGIVGRHGLALLSRAPATDAERIPLPRAHRRATPRVGLVADAGGVRVAVGHLSIEREEARRQLDVLARALTARQPPWLLLGDLNLRPPDVAAVIAPLGLALPASNPATYPAGAPAFAVDHVAAGGGMAVVEGSAVAVASVASDHRPLLVEVR